MCGPRLLRAAPTPLSPPCFPFASLSLLPPRAQPRPAVRYYNAWHRYCYDWHRVGANGCARAGAERAAETPLLHTAASPPSPPPCSAQAPRTFASPPRCSPGCRCGYKCGYRCRYLRRAHVPRSVVPRSVVPWSVVPWTRARARGCAGAMGAWCPRWILRLQALASNPQPPRPPTRVSDPTSHEIATSPKFWLASPDTGLRSAFVSRLGPAAPPLSPFLGGGFAAVASMRRISCSQMWAFSGHSVGIQWAFSGHAVGMQWAYSGHAVCTQCARSAHAVCM